MAKTIAKKVAKSKAPAAKKGPVKKKPVKVSKKATTTTKPKTPVAPAKPVAAAKPVPVAAKSAKAAVKPVAAKPVPAAVKPGTVAVKLSPVVVKPAPVSAKGPKGPVVDKPGSAGGSDLAEAAARGAKVVSPLKPKDLEIFRDMLIMKRRELLGDVQSMEEEALQSTTGSNLSNLPMHMADMGTDNYEQEFTLGLVEKDRQMLHEINLALDKIKKGTYGICEGTGKPISKARLDAKPWARYSLEHTLKVEKGLIRR